VCVCGLFVAFRCLLGLLIRTLFQSPNNIIRRPWNWLVPPSRSKILCAKADKTLPPSVSHRRFCEKSGVLFLKLGDGRTLWHLRWTCLQQRRFSICCCWLAIVEDCNSRRYFIGYEMGKAAYLASIACHLHRNHGAYYVIASIHDFFEHSSSIS
jgi:hypothetical protein